MSTKTIHWKNMVADLIDESFANLNDWTEIKSGAFTGVIVSGELLHMLNDATSWGGFHQTVVGGLPDDYTIEFKLYLDDLSGGKFALDEVRNGVIELSLEFDPDGEIYIYDGTSNVKVTSTTPVKMGGSAEWQTWRILVRGGEAGTATCDIYLKDSTHNYEKIVENADCSNAFAGSDGYFWFNLNGGGSGTATECHIDYIKVDTGLRVIEEDTDTIDVELIPTSQLGVGITKRVDIEMIAGGEGFGMSPILHEISGNVNIAYLKENLHDIVGNSDIRYQGKTEISGSVDIRCISSAYSRMELGAVSDFIVKLDSVTLVDVNLESVVIDFRKGVNPSEAIMTLARRHDNLDKDLDGNASQITNENKIQIYDDTKLLFTGYITQINPNSANDTVEIIAQDARYKINRLSPTELYYGYYVEDEPEGVTIYSNNQTALTYLLDYLVTQSYITSYETNFLSNFNIELEGKDITNHYGELIETLVKESGTFDWYIDENEKLRFVTRGSGTIKELSLAGLTSTRHIHDVILNDITLNKKMSTYIKGLKVRFGQTHNVKYWIGDNTGDRSYRLSQRRAQLEIYQNYDSEDKTRFGFQFIPTALATEYGENYLRYTGEGTMMLNNQFRVGFPDFCGYGYVVYTWFQIFQVKLLDEYVDINSEVVGDSSDVRDFDMSMYGAQVSDTYYEERSEEDGTWLYKIESPNYNFIEYAKDLANLELYRNNELLTTASVSLFLDAFSFYDLSFGSLINLDNTIESGIYKNNNEFPLDIDSYTLTLRDRIVTLNLTNYNGGYFKRSVNYSSGDYSGSKETKLYEKIKHCTFSF